MLLSVRAVFQRGRARRAGRTGSACARRSYSDPACLIECGDPGTAYAYRESEEATFGAAVGQISAGEVYIGSRGVVNLTGAEPGAGLRGTTVTCECDYMWTGPHVLAPVPVPVRRGARDMRHQRPRGFRLRTAVDRRGCVRRRVDGFTGGVASARLQCAEPRSQLLDAVLRLRPRHVSGRRQLPLRLRVHMAGAPGATSDIGERAHQPVSGALIRTVLPGEVPHVRGEASVQHERRAIQRDVRPEQGGFRR